MKTKRIFLIFALAAFSIFCSPLATAFAQGTAFTYQGRLNDGANPASGSFDLRCSVYDALAIGNVVAGPITNAAIAVSNGLFTVTLDFGTGVFTGPDRWLDIGVRTNGGGAFTTLTPRQPLTPTPYANFAGGVNASGVSGTIPAAGLGGTYGNPVIFNNGANSFDGTFYGQFFGSSFIGGNFVGNFIGSGSGLSDVWHTGGNLGTTAGLNFLGTTDFQPLQLHVNLTRAFRLEPTLNDGSHASIVNVIGGSPVNSASNGVYGATIAGGGASSYFGFPARNLVTKDFGTVGGGFGNTASGNNATVGGGDGNTASELEATIGGGHQNISSGGASTVGGGFFNISSNSSSTVAGGAYNLAGGQEAAVGGGYANAAVAGYAVIAGGYYNTNNGLVAFIGAGDFNSVGGNGSYSFLGGGYQNINNGYISTLGGGYLNSIQSNADYTFMGGGSGNILGVGTTASTIVGGVGNIMQSLSGFSFMGGGNGNVIGTNNGTAVIVGGLVNTIGNFSDRAAIVGGNGNAIQNNSLGTFIGGGIGNTIGNNSGASTIAGGNLNYILNNTIQATIGGGLWNTNGGFAATVPGGVYNVALGADSFAAGQRAKATNDGAFVWADSQNADFGSTTTNQFNVRANGGVRFVTGGAGITLDGQPLLSSGNFIQNQSASPQAASFNIAGSGNISGAASVNSLNLTNTLRVPGAGIGTSTPAFVHRATAGNIEAGNTHRTTITHPLCDGDPNAILIITHNYNPGGVGGVLDVNPTSVFYNTGLAKWQIYHDNTTVAITANDSWNVLIIKP